MGLLGTETLRVNHNGNPVEVTIDELAARSARQLSIPALGGKVGATAGWVVTAGTDKSHATLPASKTASTLIVPVRGLEVGDTIIAFSLAGQIESAGGAVTLDADLREQTAAAADNVDASIGAITQIAVTADAVVSASKTGLSEVVTADATYYVLITGTTAGSTDIDLLSITITVNKGRNA